MEHKPPEPDGPDSILVIRTGGIGAFVQALSAFAAIRMFHSGARITLLTDAELSSFAAVAPYFDVIETEAGRAGGLHGLVRERPWSIVYDLDTSSRTDRLYQSSKPGARNSALIRRCGGVGRRKGARYPMTTLIGS